MSNARKLQTEIDRVMKKVDEGVELFDEIWEKVYSAEQQNQKEKYEMDLKKEIKKLQRLRDQIKTWIGSSDIKDKDPLIEARKLIETKMEQFKICEKETKTKTYSKEGLARQEKLDPTEEAKLNTTTWLGEYIERIAEEIEEKDFEIERLSSGKGKKTNKHAIEQMQQHIANHKFHMSKLEGIIRLVNNDVVDAEAVDQIKDDLDFYLESYQEDEYMQTYDEEYIYETLGLDDLDIVNVDRVTNPEPVKKSTDDTASTNSKGSKSKKVSKVSTLASVIPMTIGRARTIKENEELQSKEADLALAREMLEKAKATPTPVKVARSGSTSSSQSTGSGPPAPARAPAATPSPAHSGGTSMAAILKRETEQQEKERQKLLREQQAQQQAEQLRQQQAQRQQQEAQARQQELARQQQQAQQEALKRQQQEALRQQQAQQEAAAQQQQQQQAAQLQAQQQAAEQKSQTLQPPQMQSQNGQNNALDILTSGLGGLGLGGGGDSRSESGSTSLGPPAPANQGAGAGSTYLAALDESFANAPNAVDNERSRPYTPQNPYPTPASYPSTPSSIFDNPAVFEKLGTDCLFFIFYYAQGTYQQYLAARELKKQSWRFHKKYMTWFQRHEEPKITTDDYEQGTYVYFDYETGWCTRIKQDFRFEYSFLEDSLQ